MSKYIYLTVLLVAIAIGAALYFYMDHSRDSIRELTTSVVTYQDTIDSQAATIATLRDDVAVIRSQVVMTQSLVRTQQRRQQELFEEYKNDLHALQKALRRNVDWASVHIPADVARVLNGPHEKPRMPGAADRPHSPPTNTGTLYRASFDDTHKR